MGKQFPPSCYKHTFYGIASYSCMEATPSLACANKCVFCWRHHKNPVAKKWSWRMDPPQMIVDGWLTEHAKLIKQLKGVPGVSKERFEAASKIRHCALSLVGEPIMYPEINKVLELLHDQQISSFLVTNAQFPDQIKTLGPCTQLYTSIDAATKEELLRVDRPLNEDFYERFLASIDNLRGVQFSRSVFRLTLVKSFNMTETAEYAKLVGVVFETLAGDGRICRKFGRGSMWECWSGPGAPPRKFFFHTSQTIVRQPTGTFFRQHKIIFQLFANPRSAAGVRTSWRSRELPTMATKSKKTR